MPKVIHILSNIGKVVTLYLVLLIISLVCISFSSSFNPKYHQRCVLKSEDYDLSFLSSYNEVEKYEVYVSCNTLDILIFSKLDNKQESLALMIDLSYKLPKYSDMEIVLKLKNEEVLYFKVQDKGVVLVV